MRVLGLLLLVGGFALSVFALLKMPTTVGAADALTLGIEHLPSAGDTLNIGLLQEQALIFHAGLAIAVVGSVFLAAGVVAQVIVSAADTLIDEIEKR